MTGDRGRSSAFEENGEFICQDAERDVVRHGMMQGEPEDSLFCGGYLRQSRAPQRRILSWSSESVPSFLNGN